MRLLLPGAPRAATLIEAQTGFSAERTLVVDGHTYQGKVWAMPGKERHEQALYGLQPVFLLRADHKLAEIVLQGLKTVVEFEIPAELRLLDLARLKTRPIGSETVNGVATTKYAIDKAIPGGPCRGHAVAEPRRHSDAPRRHVQERERQGLDGPLGAERRQDRPATGRAVRAPRRNGETAPRGDRPAARAEGEGGRAVTLLRDWTFIMAGLTPARQDEASQSQPRPFDHMKSFNSAARPKRQAATSILTVTENRN